MNRPALSHCRESRWVAGCIICDDVQHERASRAPKLVRLSRSANGVDASALTYEAIAKSYRTIYVKRSTHASHERY